MDLSIVHPSDPWNQGLGGFDACIDGVLRQAPADWRLELIGVSADPKSFPAGQWTSRSFADRTIRFFAALGENTPDKVKALPLSLRFAVACRVRGVAPTGRVVQFHRFESGLACRLRADQRAVYFLHNHPEEVDSRFSDLRWKRLGWLFRRVLRGRLQHADWIVGVDPRTPNWAAEKFSRLRGHTTWLQQWADPDVFNPGSFEQRVRTRREFRERLGLKEDAKLIGFVGRIERQKDPLTMVEAFAEVVMQHRSSVLVVVGSGRLKGFMRQHCDAMGVGEQVRFLPPVSRDRLAEYYKALDVIACSSGFESGPRVVFEALACGTAVVSFEVGQVPELLSKGRQAGVGEVVTSRSPHEFALALLRTLSAPISQARVLDCANLVHDHTPARALSPLFDLYDSWNRG